DLVTTQETTEKLGPPPGWFQSCLQAGRCLVMLDGLDEVADESQRKAVSAWVDKQVEHFPENFFIVTSRPHGYRSRPLERATVVEVQPFSVRQVREFVRNWYTANEVLSFGRDDPGVRAAASKSADDLLRRVNATHALAALTVNPLLL